MLLGALFCTCLKDSRLHVCQRLTVVQGASPVSCLGTLASKVIPESGLGTILLTTGAALSGTELPIGYSHPLAPPQGQQPWSKKLPSEVRKVSMQPHH